MSRWIPCEFVLVRYVPDVVRGEFVNVGLILRTCPSDLAKPTVLVRFTENFRAMLCINPDADLDLFNGLEDDMKSHLRAEHAMSLEGVAFKPIISQFVDSFSNSIQLSDPRACLAEDLNAELDKLMGMYVERPGIRPPLPSRDLLLYEMRRQFRRFEVWELMRRQVRVSRYTGDGNPLRLDAGYSHEKTIKLFHAVSLRDDGTSARSLAYAAPRIVAGAERVERATVQLTAVVEPLRKLAFVDGQEEAAKHYTYCTSVMEQEGIRVINTHVLAEAARTARAELSS